MKTHKFTSLNLLLSAGFACYAHGGEVSLQLITGSSGKSRDFNSANVRVVLSNGTDSAVQVLDDVMSAPMYQLFIMLDNEYLMGCAKQNRILWEPKTNAWMAMATDKRIWGDDFNRTIEPGQTYTWGCTSEFPDSMIFDSLLHWINGTCISAKTNQVNIYAQVLVRPNQWVYSNTNTLYTLFPAYTHDGKAACFYYSKETTNQYLYVKTSEGKFKLVNEMKFDTRPEKEKDEDAVTFELPDGTKKKLTFEQARQIINEAGN